MAEARTPGPEHLPDRAQRQQLGRRLRRVLRATASGDAATVPIADHRCGATPLLRALDLWKDISFNYESTDTPDAVATPSY